MISDNHTDLNVDLRSPPAERWHLTPTQRQQARDLLALYTADLGLRPDFGEFLIASVRDVVRSDHWQEMESVFEEARTFSEALKLLSGAPLPCDCLLLLTGVRVAELVVIERTPSRYALRHAKGGYVCVTNGYQQLDAGLGVARSELLDTWCQRFERVQALISQRQPRDPEDCFWYLNDPQIRMHMTVQQMVFCAATGEHWLRFPEPMPPAATRLVTLPM